MTPTGPPQLVEHFFRHESAKLIAVLTRAFGVRHLDLIEDKVQEALVAAMQSWRQGGIPANPAGWIYRVARNRVLDALRREQTFQRVVSQVQPSEEATEPWLPDEQPADEQLADSVLRMIFVCCHPDLDRRSQIALTLKILCGFSLAEIARGLLISSEAAKKRVQRAKRALAKRRVRIELPPAAELSARLAAVHEVLYLMFNEGYSTSHGHEPLRDDICEEAARLTHLLAEHETFGTPETRALLALMLAHSARLDARVDADGAVILLADQDRAKWDRNLIRFAEMWLERAKITSPSRFHYEAAISLSHCHAQSIDATDWATIIRYYDRLISLFDAPLDDAPLYVLNRAIAHGESGDPARARVDLAAIRQHPDLRNYFLLDCALARLHELEGDAAATIAAYERALEVATAPHERALLTKKLERLRPS